MTSKSIRNNQKPPTDARIVDSLERISQAFRVLLWQEGMEFSLSPIQIQLIIFMDNHPAHLAKVSNLAAEFNLTKATISDAVKSLEQKKMVKKIYEPNDFRSYTLHLTAKGRSVAGRVAQFNDEIFTPVGQLQPEQKETLLSGLLNIIKHLNEAGVVTVNRMCYSCKHFSAEYKGQSNYCRLMDAALHTSQIQIDCADHEVVEAD